MKKSKIKGKKVKEKNPSFLKTENSDNKQNFPLKITVSGHHIHITKGLEDAVKEKAFLFFSKFKKAQHLEAKITLEKHLITVHLLLKIGHETLSTYFQNPDAYVAIHKGMQKLKQIATKHTNILSNSRKYKQSKGEVDAKIEEQIPYSDIENFNHNHINSKNKKIIPVLHKKVRQISQRKMHLKTLSEKEAIKELESSTDMILFFLGNEDHKFKLIYEKDYGHYDIIEIGEAKYY